MTRDSGPLEPSEALAVSGRRGDCSGPPAGNVGQGAARLLAVAAGWRTAARYAALSDHTVVIAARFSEPCVQFGYDLWHAKRLVEARDAERRP